MILVVGSLQYRLSEINARITEQVLCGKAMPLTRSHHNESD